MSRIDTSQQQGTVMLAKRNALLLIGISIVFAVAMVVGDHFTEGMAINRTLPHWLTAAWFVPFTLLSVKGGRCC